MHTVYLGTARPFATPPALRQRLVAASQQGARIRRSFTSGTVVFHAYWPRHNLMQGTHNL